jgi:hypothetical protein
MPRISDLTSLFLPLTSDDTSVYVVGGATVKGPPSGCGVKTLFIRPSDMVPTTTAGAGAGLFETTTNKVMVRTLDFNSSTRENAQFSIRMPKSWDLGGFQYSVVWSHPTTVTNFGVSWGLEMNLVVNADPLDSSWNGATSAVDTGGIADSLYVMDWENFSNPYPLPYGEDYVTFQVYRNVDNPNDNLAVDARLHGISLKFITFASTDD